MNGEDAVSELVGLATLSFAAFVFSLLNFLSSLYFSLASLLQRKELPNFLYILLSPTPNQ